MSAPSIDPPPPAIALAKNPMPAATSAIHPPAHIHFGTVDCSGSFMATPAAETRNARQNMRGRVRENHQFPRRAIDCRRADLLEPMNEFILLRSRPRNNHRPPSQPCFQFRCRRVNLRLPLRVKLAMFAYL